MGYSKGDKLKLFFLTDTGLEAQCSNLTCIGGICVYNDTTLTSVECECPSGYSLDGDTCVGKYKYLSGLLCTVEVRVTLRMPSISQCEVEIHSAYLHTDLSSLPAIARYRRVFAECHVWD